MVEDKERSNACRHAYNDSFLYFRNSIIRIFVFQHKQHPTTVQTDLHELLHFR